MAYVDGFVLAVPRSKIKVYRAIAQKAGRIWRRCGALEYREAVGDDLKVKWGMPFTRMARTRAGETVVFSWIVYKSRAHRDRVNARVMKDTQMVAIMNDTKMPFDLKRMAYGGFKIIVST